MHAQAGVRGGAAVRRCGGPGVGAPVRRRYGAAVPADDARGADLVVLADDRTGALETAGACADAGCGPVEVRTPGSGRGPRPDAGGVVVVDLGSRHEAAGVAAERARSADGGVSARVAHKIDSTLRGNWAAELVARAAGGRRVVLVPAFPRAGRTCVGGVVLEDGRPVHEGGAGSDPLSPVRSSRPAEHLRRAGASEVAELPGPHELRAWLASGGGRLAVVDAQRDDELREVGETWAAAGGVVLAGTAAAVAAGAAACAGGRPVTPAPALVGPALVVVGSLHPRARAQVEALRARGGGRAILGVSDVEAAARRLAGGCSVVIVTEAPDRHDVDAAAALAAATSLARVTDALVARRAPPTLLVIGGDTAAAVLGDEPRVVGGTVSTGLAWSRLARGDGPLVLTRAGGFGDDGALSRLLADLVVGASRAAQA